LKTTASVEPAASLTRTTGLGDDFDVVSGGWIMANLAIGDRDRAIEEFETAIRKIERHEVVKGFFNLINLKMNPMADPLLEEPEFVALRKQIRGD
jgi:hypothetical protein